ncbi:tryptophan 7-halogenase [Acaryochloris sp. IP29b_bin.148]|uniref:NAD(P)/FAD-dependent oxidoreductase n=1 Tax=Acaryochloris sp. IP29b_bin.148 TaxID=2969218 RepID=UPI002607320A|nr:tryptophan 7-halogenase [Acaryochloris sp. IP29b_bin.148]
MKLKPKYDVVILGGGPAGLAAAISIRAKVDASVLVVEAQAPDQERVGENCPPDIIVLLKQLGIAKAFNQAGHETCPGYASLWGSDHVGFNDFIVNPMGPSWRLNRKLFDKMLVEQAEEAKVQFSWSTRFCATEKPMESNHGRIVHLVTYKPNKIPHTIEAGFVIDATGFEARFARALNINKVIDDQLCATLRFAKVLKGQGSKRVQLEAFHEGWCYHSLLPENRVVSMIVTEKESLSALRANGYQGFEEALAATSFVSRSASQLTLGNYNYRIFSIQSGLLPIVEGDDWIAIGDAAASYDPIAAQGIYKGLSHGLLAADKVAAWFMDNDRYSSRFSELVKQQFANYRKNRMYVYGLERRWAESNFWRKREKFTSLAS